MSSQMDISDLSDALDHISRVALKSATLTRRLRWIAGRADCALNGTDWKDLDLPRVRSNTTREYKLESEIAELKTKVANLEAQLDVARWRQYEYYNSTN